MSKFEKSYVMDFSDFNPLKIEIETGYDDPENYWPHGFVIHSQDEEVEPFDVVANL